MALESIASHVTSWCYPRIVASCPPDRTFPSGPISPQELAECGKDPSVRSGGHHHGPGGVPEISTELDPAPVTAPDLGWLRGDPSPEERPEDAVDPGDLP